MNQRTTRFWVARFVSERDFFRTFTSWGMLLTSLGRMPGLLHPSWHSKDFRIFYINTEVMEVRDVTATAIAEAAHYRPTDEEREADEPAAQAHY